MEVQWLDNPAAAPPQIAMAVEVLQTESDEFKDHSSFSMNVEAKEYNRAVLDYVKKELESMPGVKPDPKAQLRVTIASVLPESSRNHAVVGCVSILTVFVFPVFAVYEYPVEITLYQENRKIKSYLYSYNSSYAIGWLLMPLNLLVTPFNDSMYSTVGGRLQGIEPVFSHKVARINRWILKDLQEVQR